MNQHTVSNFNDFLEEVSARVQKRLLALQLADIMEDCKMTKTSLAEKLKTSRSQLDRILDPDNTSITIEVFDRVAHAVAKHLRIEFT